MEHLIIDESLLARYFGNAVSEEEKRAVENWINCSEENKKIAQQIAHIYFMSDLLDVSKKVSAQEEYNIFRDRLKRKERLRIWKRVGRVAAVLVLPIIIFSVYMITGHEDTPISEQFVEVRTQIGVTNSIVLPDSSVVYLNSESVLKYPSHFTNNRKVYLQGEAYFVVKKQQGARFVVNTPVGAKVEVLGTEFNVNAGLEDVDATLVKGSVKFVCQAEGNREKDIRIVPGQKLSYNAKSKDIGLEEVDIAAEIGWIEGKMVFRDCPLMETLDILSKRFNVEFIVKNNSLKENNFTGSFKNQSLEQILDNFAISTNLKYKYVNKRASMIDSSEREIIELY